jgi:putative oxidoreductase
LLVAAGFMTRFAALLFAAFCLLTAIVFHRQFSDQNQLLHFQKDLAIAGGFIVLACCGSGNWSIDRYLAWAKN